MITIKTKIEWEENLKFNATSGAGHNISMGSGDDENSPLELLLMGLGGCTGIDVVLILEKMKAEIENFDVDIEGERADEHPKRFKKIHINYYFKGKNLDEKKVEKAINLSENKYCSASASLNAEITSSYEIEHTD